MSDRGDYRSFYCAFWDDADIHAMSDNAYRVLTTIKGTLTAAGIGVVYLSQLADRCGKTSEQLQSALVELEQPKPDSEFGWIVRERNIIWIVNGLRYEPTLTSTNSKHRTFVRERLLAPLGERTIVAAFRRYYAEWFVDAAPTPKPPKNDTVPDTYRDAIDGVSKHIPIQSFPSLPDPTQSNPSQPDAADVGCATALNIAVWSNTAVAEQWGERPTPYTPAQAEGTADVLRKLGVEAGTVRLSIYRQCRESKQLKPPRGPGYFRQGIETDWDAELARRAVVASGETPPPQSATPDVRPARATGAEVFAKIRALVNTSPDPRQGTTRFIPLKEVEAMGPQALHAYNTIGGAARVLAAMQDPKGLGFLIREFSDAYNAALNQRASA